MGRRALLADAIERSTSPLAPPPPPQPTPPPSAYVDGAPLGPVGYDPGEHGGDPPPNSDTQKKKNLDRLRKMGVLQGVMIMPSGKSTVPKGGYVPPEDDSPTNGAAAMTAGHQQSPNAGHQQSPNAGHQQSPNGAGSDNNAVNEPSALPSSSPWGEHHDPETGQTYFFNTETGESAWTKPQAMTDAEEEYRQRAAAEKAAQQAPTVSAGRGTYSAVRGRHTGPMAYGRGRGRGRGRGNPRLPHGGRMAVHPSLGSPRSTHEPQSSPINAATSNGTLPSLSETPTVATSSGQQQATSGDTPTNSSTSNGGDSTTANSTDATKATSNGADVTADGNSTNSPDIDAANASEDAGSGNNEDGTGESLQQKIRKWTAHLDPDTNRTYYFNVDTDESLWERPNEYFSEEDDEEEDGGSRSGGDDDGDGDGPSSSRGKSRWTAHEDPEYGEIYYYCADSGESVWIRPEDYWTDHEDHGVGDQSEDENDGAGGDGYLSGGDEVKSGDLEDTDPMMADVDQQPFSTGPPSMPRKLPHGMSNVNSHFSDSFRNEMPVQTDGAASPRASSPRVGALLSSPSMSLVSPALQEEFDTSDGVRNIGVEHCGWLMKVAGMTFKPRWFQIFENRIRYFLDESCTKFLGQIEIKQIKMIEVDPKKKKWGFNVEIPGRTYYFAASSKPELYEWLRAIRRKCKVLNEGHMYGVESHHYMGVLKKQKQNSKRWKTRFFALTNNALLYFQNEADAHYYVNLTCFSRELHNKAAKRLLGSMTIVGPAIQNASVSRIGNHSNQQHCFRVSTGPRTMYLSCSTTKDLDTWMVAIEERLNPPKPQAMLPLDRQSVSTARPPTTAQTPATQMSAAAYGQQQQQPKRGSLKMVDTPAASVPELHESASSASLLGQPMNVPLEHPPMPPHSQQDDHQPMEEQQPPVGEQPHDEAEYPAKTSADVSNPESSHTPQVSPSAGRSRPLPPAGRGGVATPIVLSTTAAGRGPSSSPRAHQSQAHQDLSSQHTDASASQQEPRTSISASRSAHSHSVQQQAQPAAPITEDVATLAAEAEQPPQPQEPEEEEPVAAVAAPATVQVSSTPYEPEEQKIAQASSPVVASTPFSHTSAASTMSSPYTSSTPASPYPGPGPSTSRAATSSVTILPGEATHPEDWTTGDVGTWLRSLGKKIESYAEEFEENGIDGDFLMNVLTQETLSELVEKKIHCSLIWRKVTKLRDEHAR